MFDSDVMKAVFVRPLLDMQCKDGESVTLECAVAGYPRLQISWFKEEQEIMDSQVSYLPL